MKHKLIERALVGILLIIAAGIVVHAPLIVWAGSHWPQYGEVIKAWKELLMAAALVLLVIATAQRKKINELMNDHAMQLALIFAGLHFVMIGVFQNGLKAAGAGLLIDLRYVLYFVVVYGTIRLFPHWRKLFIRVFAAGAVVVLGFALLQLFVLPKDVLVHLGYNKNTIAPYLTVDQNPSYVRINSTLRGPNPVGAYAVIILGMLAAVVRRRDMNGRRWLLVGMGTLAAGLTLGASYSRSSVIGAIVALLVIVAISVSARVRKKIGLAFAGIIVVGIAAIAIFHDSPVISNIILHDNPTTVTKTNSNAGHVDSLVDGLNELVKQPLGAGVGSTGSASLGTSAPYIVENQYLFIAHEIGWAGLIIFVLLFIEVMSRLWHRRASALALGVFGSGVGLAVIGLLLPVWVDDTVSIVWWGLAALAIATTGSKEHGTRKSH